MALHNSPRPSLTRRSVATFLAGGAAAAFLPGTAQVPLDDLITKPIPSTGEHLPIVGLGSWITFNVGRDPRALASCTDVMAAFFRAGGRMIDSSPMYGSSQATIGQGLTSLGQTQHVFATDKVWTNGTARGRAQISDSLALWNVPKFALLQVHNLVDWQAHLPTLFEMKRSGTLDYVGVTTSHGRRHRELEQIIATQPVDFVQLTYNILRRAAEDRLLPLAAEHGVAVIANRPFGGGRLVKAAKRHQVPEWARAEGINGWPDFLLKFIASHPSVTCAIPATTSVTHVQENMLACRGVLPSAAIRRRMVDHFREL